MARIAVKRIWVGTEQSGGRDDAAECYRKALPAVVGVRADGANGSGFLLDPRGVVATCCHVVQGQLEATVRLPDSSELPARVLRRWRRTDLAFLLLPSAEYPYLELEEGEGLAVGQPVLAVGHPKGLANTLSRGVVSGLGRQFRGAQFLQTDASFHAGISGGPLLNASGRVVGVCAWVMDSPSLSFAIPAGVILRALGELQKQPFCEPDLRHCRVCGSLELPEAFCGCCGSTLVAFPPPAGSIVKIDPDQLQLLASKCGACERDFAGRETYCTRCGATRGRHQGDN